MKPYVCVVSPQHLTFVFPPCFCYSDPFLIFNGGMPRASYGDRHGVTIIHGKTHTVLDFTSKVVDIFIMTDSGPEHGE